MAEGVFDPEVYGEPVYTDNQADTEVYGELGDDTAAASNAYGQAQALITITQVYGQAQADILHAYQGYGQCQADIKQTYQGYGQAQGSIVKFYQAYGQAQGTLLTLTRGHGQSQAVITPKAPVVWWKFDDTSGNFADSADSKTLTANGTPTYSQGSKSAALGTSVLWDDSSTDYGTVTVGSPIPTGSAARTFEGWFKTTSTGRMSLWSYGTTNGSQAWTVAINHDGNNQFGIWLWANDDTGHSATTSDGFWHYFAITYNGSSQILLYYDGALLGTFNCGSINTASGGTMYVGRSIQNAEFFSGSVDNFKIYDYQLSAAQIALNYAEGSQKAWGQAQGYIAGAQPGWGQAQADILQTYQKYAQAQSDIVQTYQAYGQAQADIKQTYQAYAQVNADIKATSQGYGQAQGFLATSNGFGQSQADILQTYQGYAQAQADIKATYQGYGQCQSIIISTYQAYGQAQAQILAFDIEGFGQSQADIKAISNSYAQAQGDIKQTYQTYAQAQATILGWGFGQAQADIKQTSNGFGQSNSDIKSTSNVYAQCQARIKIVGLGFAQCQATLSREFSQANGQANANILRSYRKYAQANADIDSSIKVKSGCAQAYILKSAGYGQAQAWITLHRAWAQAEADIKQTYRAYATARAFLVNRKKHGHAMADIKKTTRAPALAVGYIFHPQGFGQARAYIAPGMGRGYGQANALIIDNNRFGQAQAKIKIFDKQQYAQAQGRIKIFRINQPAQANALINYGPGFGQALATIVATGTNKFGQARAHILGNMGYGQAQGYIAARAGLLLYDTFTRVKPFGDAVGLNSFGSPDYGPNWINFNSDTLSARIDGSKVILDNTVNFGSGQDAYFYVHSLINQNNANLYAEFLKSSESLYTSIYFELRDNFIFVRKQLGSDEWQMAAWNGSSYSIASNTSTTIADTWYSIRLRAFNASVKFKVWPTGTPEPDTWLLTISNAQSHVGWVGIYADNTINFSGDTTILGYTYVDNVNVEYPGTPQSGQAQAFISQPNPYQFGQAQAFIYQPSPCVLGQAQAVILATTVWGQAEAYILLTINKSGQAMAHILGNNGYGQANALIAGQVYAQAMAQIRLKAGYGQAQASISSTRAYGQALGTIFNPWAFGQARARINQYPRKYAQAQAYIRGAQVGQAQALIDNGQRVYAQAQAYISSKSNKYGQAKALITNTKKHGQALAIINNSTVVYNDPTNKTPTYIVKYNEYILPGYAQEESMEAPMKINTVGGRMWNIPFSEYIGLENKSISLRMRVVGTSYLDAKNQSQRAATIVRTKRSGFAKLYIQYADRYYEAIARSIKIDNSAIITTSFDYNLEFEAKPWLTSDIVFTETGTGLVTTTGRTINDGGWTPTTMRMTGTNITVSGYTATGDYAGFVSVSGYVSNLEIDSETMDTNIDGVFFNQDYRLYVGPGVTNFQVNGATDFTLTYRNRWYL